jgi:uncharacterized protein YigE (DUF2233 family)
MKSIVLAIWSTLLLSTSSFCSLYCQTDSIESKFLTYVVNPAIHPIEFFWKSENGQLIKSLGNLKNRMDERSILLIFATNGGMFKDDRSPVGLFIQNGFTFNPIDTSSGSGNFYLKPNGVFYITPTATAGITTTGNFNINSKIKYATQSGPMLVIDGSIHPSFVKNSTNLNIRSGVGILPDGKVVFVLSKQPVNFYTIAEYFRNFGCRNALYLDGFVSRTFLPEKYWKQTDGDFGVIIGVLDHE